MPGKRAINPSDIWTALGIGSNGIPKRTGSNSAGVIASSVLGESLLAAANAAALRLLSFGMDIQIASSKPATRSDGSALQSGDRWLDTSTSERQWFYWDGTYWLSEVVHRCEVGSVSLTGSGGTGGMSLNTASNLYLIDVTFAGRINSGTNNGTNFWTLSLVRQSSSTTVVESSYNTSTLAGGAYFRNTNTLNAHRDVSGLNLQQLEYQIQLSGIPPTLIRPSLLLRYRVAKP